MKHTETDTTHAPGSCATSRISRDRQEIFNRLRTEVEEKITLRDVSSPALQARGHSSYVWDATTLPTESHYVPVFLALIEEMEASGEIDPNRHILVETTTGNAGAAAAYVARSLGYPIIIFMPEEMPKARIQDVKSYLPDDSELRLTSGGKYVAGMVQGLREFLIGHRSGYRGKELAVVNHSRRPTSVAAIAHAVDRALSALPEGEEIQTTVVALGNGTTGTGVSRAVLRRWPEAEAIGVEPLESPWFFTQKFGTDEFRKRYSSQPGFHTHHLIGTGGWGVRFPNMDLNILDNILLVSEDQWREALAALVRRGYSVGHTSAACQAIVERLSLLREGTDASFFSMFYDPLSKY